MSKIDKIFRLMDYLHKTYYIFPTYKLPLLPEADGINYRPERIFKFIRDGTISYYGMGYDTSRPSLYKDNVKVHGIMPNETYLNRIYEHIADDVRVGIRRRVIFSKMKYAEKLVLKFNNIEFINNKENQDEVQRLK